MKRIIVASNNQHKIKEIKDILGRFPLEVLSLKDAGINCDIEETGTTFMENAYIKASEIFRIAGSDMVLADDSGLMVDSLGGAPGIYSARFAGEHGNDKKNNHKLLELLKDKSHEDRKARFVCAMVLVVNKNEVIKVQGEVEGYITAEEAGVSGFGYDPLFYIPEYSMTFAEMDPHIKNKISHRAQALNKLVNKMEKVF